MPGIRYLSPRLNTRTQIIAETSNWNTQVQGTSEELPDIRSWPMQFGSFFTAQDVARAAKVAVLGSVDARSAVRRRRRSDRRDRPHQQPAVPGRRRADQKGQAAMGQDQDDTVIVPYTTVQKKLLGVQHVSGITISAADGVAARRGVGSSVTRCCATRHQLAAGDDDDFMVRTQAEMTTC